MCSPGSATCRSTPSPARTSWPCCNPAGDAISAALPNNNTQVTHRAALPHPQVGAAVAKVRRSGAYSGAVLSFEFLVLTAARSAEVRGATWDEIDVEAAVWTIPAQRMKAAREHRVPLSDRALAVLDQARTDLPKAGNLVFPSQKGRMQGHHPMGKMMRKLEIGAVPHGFRSSFRDWAGECTPVMTSTASDANSSHHLRALTSFSVSTAMYRWDTPEALLRWTCPSAFTTSGSCSIPAIGSGPARY